VQETSSRKVFGYGMFTDDLHYGSHVVHEEWHNEEVVHVLTPRNARRSLQSSKP